MLPNTDLEAVFEDVAVFFVSDPDPNGFASAQRHSAFGGLLHTPQRRLRIDDVRSCRTQSFEIWPLLPVRYSEVFGKLISPSTALGRRVVGWGAELLAGANP